MIRIRFYRVTLSLPLMLAAVGVVISLVNDASLRIGLNPGTLLFAAGLVLQVLFALIFACPRCGKSPYAIGPSFGPFALAGKPIHDRQCSKCGFDLEAEKAVDVRKLDGGETNAR
jgi:hypothetical protein